MKAPASAATRGLTPDEQAALLAHVRHRPRTVAIYRMAIELRLGARQLCELNVGDVSSDGRSLRQKFILEPSPPLSFLPFSEELRASVMAYIAWRCSCTHMRLPLRTYLDHTGVARCHACHDDIRTSHSPLFIGHRSRRISPKRLRNEFAEHRREANLDPSLRFHSLRLTSPKAAVVP